VPHTNKPGEHRSYINVFFAGLSRGRLHIAVRNSSVSLMARGDDAFMVDALHAEPSSTFHHRGLSIAPEKRTQRGGAESELRWTLPSGRNTASDLCDLGAHIVDLVTGRTQAQEGDDAAG
jgi:hypothetical protein